MDDNDLGGLDFGKKKKKKSKKVAEDGVEGEDGAAGGAEGDDGAAPAAAGGEEEDLDLDLNLVRGCCADACMVKIDFLLLEVFIVNLCIACQTGNTFVDSPRSPSFPPTRSPHSQSLGKKKKKKKTKVHAVDDIGAENVEAGGAEGGAGEEGGVKAGGLPWEGSDRDYNYEELLGEMGCCGAGMGQGNRESEYICGSSCTGCTNTKATSHLF